MFCRYSDRIRYSTLKVPARTKGVTRGTSYVTEWSSNTGLIRSWMESRNHFGEVIRVHPKVINGKSISFPHYPKTKRELNGVH